MTFEPTSPDHIDGQEGRIRLGYPDLADPEYVFNALLGHGMFAEQYPPCFTSTFLPAFLPNINNPSKHASITYMASRNTGISRQFGIPHPESYAMLCKKIKENWEDINKHIGIPQIKFNFRHVRKIKNKNYILEMNYEGIDKWQKENLMIEYSIGCSHVCKADISTCYPSIYSHSIPWAIQGIEEAKRNTNPDTHWSNALDRDIRNCNSQQTNGILIGPHTSSIVSEIVLTKIDHLLQKEGFNKVIRHIDDYTYFARDENDARKFIKALELKLKQYELLLNQKKTFIIPLTDYFNDDWPQKLANYKFPPKKEIGFTSINSFVNYALSLAKKNNNFAVINYAIKIVSKKPFSQKMSKRAKDLYVKKLLALSLLYPYLIPLLEQYVFSVHYSIEKILKSFLPLLFNQAIKTLATDSLAFCFYFAIKFDTKIENLPDTWIDSVISFDDCISTLLAWKYARKFEIDTTSFNNKIRELDGDKRKQDQFWLFLYEHAANASSLPKEQNFLRDLKNADVTFFKFD